MHLQGIFFNIPINIGADKYACFMQNACLEKWCPEHSLALKKKKKYANRLSWQTQAQKATTAGQIYLNATFFHMSNIVTLRK